MCQHRMLSYEALKFHDVCTVHVNSVVYDEMALL